MIVNQKKSPKVSILIPTYNRENLIGECIQSALNQTYTDIEIIVGDNASNDKTWVICEEYAASDPRIRIYRNETNIGPVRNWQRCICEARGEYGKILFSDDLIDPQFVEKTLPLLTENDVGFVFTSVSMGRESWKGDLSYRFFNETGIYPVVEFINASLFGGDVPISPGCAIFRMTDLKKNLVLDIPSPTINDFLSHGAGPDLLLYLLTAKAHMSIGYISDPLCFFREHEGSISVSDKEQYLSRCYLQAKIWFAENYFQKDTLKNYYADVWYRSCRSTNRWVEPSRILSQFTQNSNANIYLNIVKLFASRVAMKISN